MHEEKIALVRRQIEALAAAVASRNIRHVWVVACGGSLATLDPFRYILTAETDKVSAAAVTYHAVVEFIIDILPPLVSILHGLRAVTEVWTSLPF